MRRHMSILSLAAAGLIAAPAGARLAKPQTDLHDMQCVAILGTAAEQMNEPEKGQAYMLAAYYMGKLVGRSPSFDPADFIRANPAIGDRLDIATDVPECAEEVGATGKLFAQTK
jgi:hypothetical protein